MTQINSFGAAQTLRSGSSAYRIFRLDALEKRGFSQVARLPFSIKILLENLLRHEDGERSEEHTSELQSRLHLVCRLLLEKKKKKHLRHTHNALQSDKERYVQTAMSSND